MKPGYNLKTLILITGLVFIITGCEKLYDFIVTHPGAENKSCLIRKFMFLKIPYASYQDTLTITYNILGNPVTATRPDPRTGAPNYLFKYKNGRLSDFIGVYSNGIGTEEWHRYQYDSHGRVLVDSVFVFAVIDNGNPSNPHTRFATTFGYDNQDRIIYEKNTYPDGHIFEQHYQYNADGNMIGAQFGDHVSFRRSNKIWMFLDRDYSVNDRLLSSGFNVCFMPTEINLGDLTMFDKFLGNYYYEAKLEYLSK